MIQFIILYIILPFVVNCTSSFVTEIFNGDKSLHKELRKTYYIALKSFCKNDYTRLKNSREYQQHLAQLELFIETEDIDKIIPEYKDLITTWYNELKNNVITYNFINEKLSREIIDRLNRAILYYSAVGQRFNPISDYISRTLVKDTGDNDFFTSKSSYYLFDLIAEKNIDEKGEQKNRFILYSGAQTGKTIELYQLAYQLQKRGICRPYLFHLSRYTSIIFRDFLHRVTEEFKNIVLLLDGYDEIKDSSKDDFINEINCFSDNYPDISIVISSRINFENRNNFELFQPLYLKPLSYDDIHNYIKLNYPDIYEPFIGETCELRVFELLETPFFLKEMLKYFSKHNELPKTKSVLYGLLIDESFNIDEKHKQNKGNIRSLKTKGYMLLQKVAFVMTVSEKKQLTEEELFDKVLIEDAQLVCHFGIFRKDNVNLLYGFEHVAFKEYLVANILYKISQDEVSKLIFYPNTNKLINSWYNILLLFIEQVQNNKEKFSSIIDILIENNEPVIIEASPRFLDKTKRIEIFKKVFNYYKYKGLYVDYFQFRRQLMSFANYPESILFLVDQLKLNETKTANLYNSLVLLEFADYEGLDKDEKKIVKESLNNFLRERQHEKELKNYLILPYRNAEYYNDQDIQELGEILKYNQRAEILDHYFDLLLELEDVDKYAEWIFEAQQYIRIYQEDSVHYSIRRDSVYDVYDKFKSIGNISKALVFLATEEGYLVRNKEDQYSIKKKLFYKLSENYNKTENSDIIENVLSSFDNEDFSWYSLDKSDTETAFLYRDFFSSIGQTNKLLNKEYDIFESSETKNNHKRELLIPLLMTEDYFIKKMTSYGESDSSGYTIMNYSLPLDAFLRERLSKVLVEYFKVPERKKRDWKKESQDDFDLILDYTRFKREVEYHCDLECIYIYQYRKNSSSAKKIKDCVDHFLDGFAVNDIIDTNAARKAVNEIDNYSKYALDYISRYFGDKDEESRILISEDQKVIISRLVDSAIDKGVNWNNLDSLLAAITQNDILLSQDQIEKFVPFCYKNLSNHIAFKYGLANEYSEEMAMSRNVSLLDLLIHMSSKEFINEQIEEKLESEIKYDSLLYKHFSKYIIKNKIINMYSYLSQMLFDLIDQEFIKRDMLFYISRMDDSFSLIEDRFDELSDELKLSYFSAFKKEKMPKEAPGILWDIFPRLENSYKIDCLSILLRIGYDKALNVFIKYLRDSEYVYADKFTQLSYIGDEYLDLLIEILDIILGKIDITNNRIADVVLYPIGETAVLSRENLDKVKNAFEQIIEKYNNFYFLNRNIITLTDRLYESGRYNFTIPEALSIYDRLQIT